MSRTYATKAIYAERFHGRYTPEPNTGCWLWDGTCSVSGYGMFLFKGKDRQAHRMSWYFHYGKMPKLCVLHKCDTRACVNPDHLFLGTRRDNVNDMVKKGRGSNQKKTHCKYGHPLDGDNLYLPPTTKSRPRPYRQCRKCIYIIGKRRNERLKECRR